MATEYARLAIQYLVADKPAYQGFADAYAAALTEGKKEIKRKFGLPNRSLPPDFPRTERAGFATPTTLAEVASGMIVSLGDYKDTLTEQALPDEEIARRIDPFQSLYQHLQQLVENELNQRGLTDIEPTPIESNIAYILDLYNETHSAKELLALWREHLGISYEDMGKNILLNQDPKKMRAHMFALLNQTNSEPSFRAYSQFIQGLGIEIGSLSSYVFALRLSLDFHQDVTNQPVASLLDAQKYFANLPGEIEFLGDFLVYLRKEKGGLTMDELQIKTGVGKRTSTDVENNEQVILPGTLFRYLEGLGYGPSSVESLVAVQFALGFAIGS